MSFRSLEEKLQATSDAVEMTRNSQIGPYVYPAVPAEFSNWRDEQVAWRETAALFDQSHHMLDLQIAGPDTIRLLSRVGVNTFENFAPNKAKQLLQQAGSAGFAVQKVNDAQALGFIQLAVQVGAEEFAEV